MDEILANLSLGLLMILFQEENPILIVSVLRFCLGLAAVGGVVLFFGYVAHAFRDWFR